MQVANENEFEFLNLRLKIVEGKQVLMCILNLPTVLRMCYYQLATYINT